MTPTPADLTRREREPRSGCDLAPVEQTDLASLSAGHRDRLAPIMDRDFDLRRSVYDLPADQVRMIDIAPKALIEVGGRALIDHLLGALGDLQLALRRLDRGGNVLVAATDKLLAFARLTASEPVLSVSRRASCERAIAHHDYRVSVSARTKSPSVLSSHFLV